MCRCLPHGRRQLCLAAVRCNVAQASRIARHYREAGGEHGVVMFHDAEHGSALIDALARHGDGLPANVLPVEVNEITQSRA